MTTLSERLVLPPRLSRWWAAKSPSERRTIVAVALVVATTLGWLAVWQPVQKDLAALRAAVPAERAALAEGERMAGEIAALARAAPALAGLPAGALKSATYADGHWTLDVQRTDPTLIRELDARLKRAGTPAIIATTAAGARLRIGAP